MILIDYSQVALSNILSFQRELKSQTPEEVKNLIRHATLSTLKYYKKKYGKEYGDMTICCDGRNYWRREHFPHYKASRKKAREASDLDWGLIFDTLSEIRQDIIDHFPYKVIHIDRAEADDVIASLVYLTDEFGSEVAGNRVIIISSDKDFKQLHSLSTVKQWSPMQKKAVVSKHDEIKNQIVEHIVKGDAGDGVPNILSKDDCFVQGIRQTPVSAKRLAEFLEKGIDACRNDEEKRNWQRNQSLVDFKYIPEDLKQTIWDAYINNKPKGNKGTVMNYLIANRCRLLLDDIEEF
jgi:hypothetical protein